jgi:Hypervirulence associated proteins TUDOR domain
MPKDFKVGDQVRWNSEAGRVSGVIIKKIIVDTNFKGYTHHASRETPRYLIEGDKTDHIAIHKGSALQLIPSRARKSNKAKAKKRKE